MNQRILFAMAFLAGCTGISWGQLGQTREEIEAFFGKPSGQGEKDGKLVCNYDQDGWFHTVSYAENGQCDVFISRRSDDRPIYYSERKCMLDYAADGKEWRKYEVNSWLRTDYKLALITENKNMCFTAVSVSNKGAKKDVEQIFKTLLKQPLYLSETPDMNDVHLLYYNVNTNMVFCKVVGEIYNATDQAMDVKMRLTARDEKGIVVSTDTVIPTLSESIPAKKTIPFDQTIIMTTEQQKTVHSFDLSFISAKKDGL